ncbi:MAG: OmpH family outer membrane protein [Bacteroidetes bacterium]|nr:OmpH family outer membrane protein [Bacteroidota bacterium]
MRFKHSLILSMLMIAFSSFSTAQTKIAHIDFQKLVEGLPEVDSIKAKLEIMQASYEKKLTAIETELKNKQDYWKMNPTNDPDILEIRQQEYQDLVNRYQQIQQEAQQAISAKQDELIQPVIDKVKGVIQTVAKEKGYTYVLDSSEGLSVIYGDPNHDLIAAVKAKLGVK